MGFSALHVQLIHLLFWSNLAVQKLFNSIFALQMLSPLDSREVYVKAFS